MNFERGYRLRVSGLDELAKLVGAYRAHALKIMAAAYADQIARTAVKALDARAVGVVQNGGDILGHARESVRSLHDKVTDGLYASALNCRIDFHFVGNAVLAVFAHGADRYLRPWEARRDVVKWGWSPSAPRPAHVGEKAWKDREKYWNAALGSPTAGFGNTSFRLIEDKLPTLGWAAIQRRIPPMEWRVEQCVKRLAASEKIDPASIPGRERSRLEARVRSAIQETVNETSFSAVQTQKKSRPTPVERSKPPPNIPYVKAAPEKSSQNEELSATVDHADIVVAGDGRAFMAVPHVGFRAEDRVFIQVGSRDITFSQNGIQYGTVTNIPASARDYLRSLTSITLVEVREINGKRLLRAKHTAMVSDISIGEGLRRPLQTFKRRARETGIQEID